MTLQRLALTMLASGALVLAGMCVGVLIVRASIDPLLKLESRPTYAESP